MQTTPVTLLSRCRDVADREAWREFEERYRELLLRFCRRQRLQPADAEDVVQQVFIGLSRTLPEFVYDRSRGRFRDYLYRCAKNAVKALAARPNRAWTPLDSDVHVAAAGARRGQDEAADARTWEEEWVAHHYRLALRGVRETFDEKSVEIFNRSIAGAKVAALAVEFGMSEQAIHKVRQRIRDRMEELIAKQVREEDEPDGEQR